MKYNTIYIYVMILLLQSHILIFQISFNTYEQNQLNDYLNQGIYPFEKLLLNSNYY